MLLLIPAYNEEQRIEPVLREYAAYFRAHYPGKFQLVVVLKDTALGQIITYPELLNNYQRIGSNWSNIVP